MGTEKEETTLDLDQAMVDGMDKFQGELVEAAREGTDDGSQTVETGDRTPDDQASSIQNPESRKSITPKPDDQDSPPKGQESEVGSRKSEEKETDDKTTDDEGKKKEEDPAGTDTPDEDKKDFRFKSQEDAETGYRHIQSKASKAEQEAARLRTELKKAQDAEKQRVTQEQNDKDLLDFMTEEHEKALVKIDDLDPEDETYRNKVSRIWAEKDSAVDIKRRAQGAERVAEGEAGAAETEDTPPGESEGTVWEAVKDQAKTAGIDPDDDYFRMACSFTPTEGPDGQKLSFDEQIDFAVQQTKDYHSKQEQRFQERLKKAAEKKSDEHQEENLPLGTSAADRSEEKPSKPKAVTLNDALDDVMEERML